eukprot:g26274.t1
MALDVSDDSQMIASGSADKNVRLWSCQFGNCLKSLKAHSESVMQVRFLPGTHYLATAGRDHMLKLWDCDSYELITSLQGHACEILAMALSSSFCQRSAPRTGREAAKVRTTERLMEVLDEAKEAEDVLAAEGIDEAAIEVGQGARHPCARAIANASNIYEVLLALPFAHALQLLKVILRFLEAVASLPGGEGAQARGKALSAAATLQTPCQAALIAAYVHHSELAATSSCRPILMRLKSQMQLLLQAEKEKPPHPTGNPRENAARLVFCSKSKSSILPTISVETLPKLAWLAAANLVYVSFGLIIGSLSVWVTRPGTASLRKILTATPAIGHANSIPFMLVGLIVSQDPVFDNDVNTAQGYVGLYLIMHSITLWGVGMNVISKEKEDEPAVDENLPAAVEGWTGPVPTPLGRQVSSGRGLEEARSVEALETTETTERGPRCAMLMLGRQKHWRRFVPAWLNRPMGTAILTAILGFIPGLKWCFVSGALSSVFGAMSALGTAGPAISLLSVGALFVADGLPRPSVVGYAPLCALIVGRLIILPACCIALWTTLRQHLSFFPKDPALMLVMCIECCTPTAYNLVTMCILKGVRAKELTTGPSAERAVVSAKERRSLLPVAGGDLRPGGMDHGDRLLCCLRAVQFANKELKRDPEVLLKALSRTASALRFLPTDLWEVPELMLEAVKKNPVCMSTLPWFQDGPDFVQAVLEQNGMALQHVAKKFQRSKAVVLTAVQQNGLALQFAHTTLRADAEVVLPAVAENGNAFCYAERVLRHDPNIAFQALALNGTALPHLGEALRSDANQVLLQVTRNEGVEEYTQPYIVPAWVPLDKERHREVVLRWLARRWNIPGWKSGGILPPRSPSRSFLPELCPRPLAKRPSAELTEAKKRRRSTRAADDRERTLVRNWLGGKGQGNPTPMEKHRL